MAPARGRGAEVEVYEAHPEKATVIARKPIKTRRMAGISSKKRP
jgi:hypothetical protein